VNLTGMSCLSHAACVIKLDSIVDLLGPSKLELHEAQYQAQYHDPKNLLESSSLHNEFPSSLKSPNIGTSVATCGCSAHQPHPPTVATLPACGTALPLAIAQTILRITAEPFSYVQDIQSRSKLRFTAVTATCCHSKATTWSLPLLHW
jgi:hypothetical protein